MCQPCAVVTTTTQVSFLDEDAWGDLKNMLLLDNQSTADLVWQREYLKNIRTVSETLHLGTNGGVLVCNQKGDLPGYGPVWFDERAIANILSLASQCGRHWQM